MLSYKCQLERVRSPHHSPNPSCKHTWKIGARRPSLCAFWSAQSVKEKEKRRERVISHFPGLCGCTWERKEGTGHFLLLLSFPFAPLIRESAARALMHIWKVGQSCIWYHVLQWPWQALNAWECRRGMYKKLSRDPSVLFGNVKGGYGWNWIG